MNHANGGNIVYQWPNKSILLKTHRREGFCFLIWSWYVDCMVLELQGDQQTHRGTLIYALMTGNIQAPN